jgi:hypothetical protein
MSNSYLNSVSKQFNYYKELGDKTFTQVTDDALFWSPYDDGNSMAIIVKHMAGNMLSRWTNFLTEDGEKSWRQRDAEFVNSFDTRSDLLAAWKKGWDCLFTALHNVSDTQLEQIVYIRNQGHTVTEAINRQLCHYSYHVGQIVFLGKLVTKEDWVSLSIPKGASTIYNSEKFGKEKSRKHFTDDL